MHWGEVFPSLVIYRGRSGAFQEVARRSSVRPSCCSCALPLTFNMGPQTVFEAFGTCHHAAAFICGKVKGGMSCRVKHIVRSCFHGAGATLCRVVCGPRKSGTDV